MGVKELQAKKETIADCIDGRIIDDSDRVAVCIKGVVGGFPATLEAIYPSWPFGCMYTVETNTAIDPDRDDDDERPSTRMTIYPRVGRGMMSFVTKIVLFETRGMSVSDKRSQDAFNFNYDNKDVADRLLHYPKVSAILMDLDNHAKFSEVVIKTDVGIYLSQPTPFNSLDVDVCRTTFKIMGELGQILFEAF